MSDNLGPIRGIFVILMYTLKHNIVLFDGGDNDTKSLLYYNASMKVANCQVYTDTTGSRVG